MVYVNIGPGPKYHLNIQNLTWIYFSQKQYDSSESFCHCKGKT